MTAKRVLVTGASGFIGRSSLDALAARGYEVHGAVSPQRDSAALTTFMHPADLLEPQAIDALLEEVRPTHLLHFAWIATPGLYWESADNYRWLAASQYLLQSFRRQGGRRAVVAGSCAEYDWSRVRLCRERESPLAGSSGGRVSAYTECKLALQGLLEKIARTEEFSYAWGRVFFQFGPYEHPKRLVASVIIDLLSEREALCTHGRQVRSFLHVADVGAAFAALLDSALEGPVNIGSEEAISIAELLQTLARRIGRPELLKLGARRAPEGEPPMLVPDVARLRDELGWRPRMNLEEGLADAVEWWRGRLPIRNGS